MEGGPLERIRFSGVSLLNRLLKSNSANKPVLKVMLVMTMEYAVYS